MVFLDTSRIEQQLADLDMVSLIEAGDLIYMVKESVLPLRATLIHHTWGELTEDTGNILKDAESLFKYRVTDELNNLVLVKPNDPEILSQFQSAHAFARLHDDIDRQQSGEQFCEFTQLEQDIARAKIRQQLMDLNSRCNTLETYTGWFHICMFESRLGCLNNIILKSGYEITKLIGECWLTDGIPWNAEWFLHALASTINEKQKTIAELMCPENQKQIPTLDIEEIRT